MSMISVRAIKDAVGRTTKRICAPRSFVSTQADASRSATEAILEREARFGAHNYSPLPVALSRGLGAEVWDVEGSKYIDFLSAYSAVNQGHCHPWIVEALVSQASRMTLTSRAVHNDMLGDFEEFVTGLFKYDKMLPMNTGVEGGETAIKLARRWAYDVKGIEDGKAKILFAENNFWGRTIAAVSSSTDPSSYSRFGPFVPGFDVVPYNDIQALEQKLSGDGNIAAFMVEPIQGEAGVVVPNDGYMRKVADVCKAHGVLLIADEVQSGLGRTGELICCDHDAVRPDILVLGKAMSGGVYPVSAVLADDNVMTNIRPGEHGSTYGGNPLACAVGRAALDVLIEEELPQRAKNLESVLGGGLREIQSEFKDVIADVRGRGLFFGVEFFGENAKDVSMALLKNGIISKPTQQTTLRFAPPLVITTQQIHTMLDALRHAIKTTLQ